MKNKLITILLGVTFFVTQGKAFTKESYEKLTKDLKSNIYTNKIVTPNWQSMKNYLSSYKKEQPDLQSIPEDDRPIRTAKVTFAIQKKYVQKDPDGNGIIFTDKLCERVVYANVYDAKGGNSFRASNSDYVLGRCVDSHSTNGKVEFVKIEIGAFAVTNLKLREDYIREVIKNNTKAFFAILSVNNERNINPGPIQDPMFSVVASVDLSSKSFVIPLYPNVTEGCTSTPSNPPESEPVTGPAPSSVHVMGTDCRMSLPLVYEALIHIEDDQQ